MLTKQAVETEGYVLDAHGTIRTPGRFEGEPWYIIHYAERDMDSDGEVLSYPEDGVGTYESLLEVYPRERKMFGLDAATTHVGFSVDDQGFRYLVEMDQEEVDAILEESC